VTRLRATLFGLRIPVDQTALSSAEVEKEWSHLFRSSIESTCGVFTERGVLSQAARQCVAVRCSAHVKRFVCVKTVLLLSVTKDRCKFPGVLSGQGPTITVQQPSSNFLLNSGLLIHQ
jgi:hypothetical protein